MEHLHLGLRLNNVCDQIWKYHQFPFLFVEEEEEEEGGGTSFHPLAPPPSSPKLKDWRKKEIKKEKRGEIK